jgi:signal transduction histidine kinase
MLMRARRHRLPPSLSEDLDEIRNTAQEALEKTRSLTQALHPAILDDAGLEEAIGWYLSVFERQTGIHVDLEKSGLSRELGEDRPIHVYRVLQEALNNLARHSRSISAWVRVRFLADRLELEVEDRGVGLDYETKESRGMGMIAMRERAALLSGRIQFLRPEQGGTLVKLDVPLEPGRVLND